MTGWEPATEAEVAMRDALRAQDQQLYFRILTRLDLLLPVAGQASAGQAPLGWGTWTTGGRTHVLAFTSVTAMRACLGDGAGATRRVPYAELAAGWPNHEWWLAVNPGLPIEGYLPAWFVAQLFRGDVRLPGRTMGARARLERVEQAARARAGADASGREAPPAAAPSAGAASPGRPPATSASAGRAPAAPVGRVPGDPATVPFPTAPSTPARTTPPSATDSPVPPIPRRPEPANGHLTVDRLGRLGPPEVDEGAARDGWPGRSTPPAPPPARSFFEPASGRSARRPSPLDQPHRAGERTVPPSRFAQGGQPFPRRRPLNEPVPEEATRAFSVDAEATQALGLGRPEEPTRPFRPAPPPPSTEEKTQALPRRRPGPADAPEAEELPPSIAEPVSGPPAGRRGFSPIVIEGTVLESRDLTEAEEPASTRPGSGPGPVVPEPYAVPTVPSASSAMATATAPPAYRAEGEEGAAPWAGPAEATVPLTTEPAGESRFEPVPPPAEPAGPLSGGSAPSGRSLFEPAARTDEPTEPPLGGAPSSGRSSVEPLDGRTDPSFAAADPAEQPTTAPAASSARPAAPAAPTAPPPWTARPTAPAASAPPPAWATQPPGPTDPTSGTPVAGPAVGDASGPAAHADVGPAAGADAGPAVRADAGPTAPAPVPADFVPANEVEEELLGAAGSGSTDGFLSTLLLARVLLPAAADSAAGSRPGDPGFVWRTEQLDGGTYVVVYTSPERLADRAEGPVDTVRVKFVQLIRRWPDESWSFAVNPGTPVGATYPGEQVLALANWAAEVGLGDDPEGEPESPAAETTPAAETRPAPPPVDPTRPVTMQKAIAPSQLAYYLERGYDRVSGFVHRATELAHLGTPAELYDALGLGHPDSPFSRDAEEIYVLRWPAYRPSLYRIPYGGQNEAAMRAMEGWVIERPPFRGNGFAPGESSDVVAEFKVDSARLPHGAQLWRIGADRTERVVAILDTDALLWRQVDRP